MVEGCGMVEAWTEVTADVSVVESCDDDNWDGISVAGLEVVDVVDDGS